MTSERTVHKMRQEIIEAAAALHRHAKDEGALRILASRNARDAEIYKPRIKTAAAYATETEAVILKIFNAAVRRLKAELGE
jgi:hypothetical protein